MIDSSLIGGNRDLQTKQFTNIFCRKKSKTKIRKLVYNKFIRIRITTFPNFKSGLKKARICNNDTKLAIGMNKFRSTYYPLNCTVLLTPPPKDRYVPTYSCPVCHVHTPPHIFSHMYSTVYHPCSDNGGYTVSHKTNI